MEFRPGAVDEPGVTDLLAHAIGDNGSHLAAVVQAYRDDPAVALLVATVDGELVGVLGYRITDIEIEVLHVATAPIRRRTGVGRRLLDALRNTGAHRLPIVAETDGDAVGFYAANDFTVASLGEKYPGVERFRVSLPGRDSSTAARTRPGWPKWATEAIELVDPDPDWHARGQRLRDDLEVLLAPWLTCPIEHVGSTAVPGLPAKPIIDLQAAVADLADAHSMATVLSKHHWHYVAPDLDQRPWRRFFVMVDGGRRTAHLHVMTRDSLRWHQQIAFRDTLRAHPSLTADYAALKRSLAAQHADDREAYSAAKGSFIQAVLDTASD